MSQPELGSGLSAFEASGARPPAAPRQTNATLEPAQRLRTDNQKPFVVFRFSFLAPNGKRETRNGKRAYAPASPALNLFSFTAWFRTTATSRPAAFSTVTRRWAGALIRKSNLLINSSRDGRVASASTSLTFNTLPSRTPALTE